MPQLLSYSHVEKHGTSTAEPWFTLGLWSHDPELYVSGGNLNVNHHSHMN
jgi:hypothetical protein